MKKILAIILSVAMMICFASCGESNNTASLEDQYVSFVQQCIDEGDTEKAIAALKEGIENTKSEKLQQMLDNLTASTTTTEKTAATTVATTATVAQTLAPTTTVSVITTAATTKKPTQKNTEAPKKPTKSVVLKLIQIDFEPYEFSPNITFYSDESVDFEYNQGNGMVTLTGAYSHTEDEVGESYSCVMDTYDGVYEFNVSRYNRNGQKSGGYYHYFAYENMGFTHDGVLFSEIS